MNIKNILQNTKKGISFEFFPAKSDEGYIKLQEVVNQLKVYNPLFYSITETGVSTELNMSAKNLALHALDKVSECLPETPNLLHYTCSWIDKKEVTSFIEANKNSKIKNVLALRGPKADHQDPSKLSYANQLIEMLAQANQFSIAMAVYPETHPESKTIAQDRLDTIRKIEAGADFAITQLFFDNNFYYDFCEWLYKENINIPIIPGILTDFNKIVKFCHGCGTSINSSLMKEVAKREDNPDDLYKYSIDFVTNQLADLQAHGVKFFQLYTLNKSQAVVDICKNLPSLYE